MSNILVIAIHNISNIIKFWKKNILKLFYKIKLEAKVRNFWGFYWFRYSKLDTPQRCVVRWWLTLINNKWKLNKAQIRPKHIGPGFEYNPDQAQITRTMKIFGSFFTISFKCMKIFVLLMKNGCNQV